MSEINVQLNNGPAAQIPAPVTVGEALKKLDRDLAKQALAARVNGREVDLAYTIDAQANGDAIKIEPVLPQTLEGLDVLRHSSAHLLAAGLVKERFSRLRLPSRTYQSTIWWRTSAPRLGTASTGPSSPRSGRSSAIMAASRRRDATRLAR